MTVKTILPEISSCRFWISGLIVSILKLLQWLLFMLPSRKFCTAISDQSRNVSAKSVSLNKFAILLSIYNTWDVTWSMRTWHYTCYLRYLWPGNTAQDLIILYGTNHYPGYNLFTCLLTYTCILSWIIITAP